MPKEVFHLFLADRYFDSGKATRQYQSILIKNPLAFFLGSISPDIFFYDLPSFYLDPLGERLHDFIGRNGTGPIHDWLKMRAAVLPPAAFAWGLGFASHFLADATWHPVIDDLAVSLDFCRKRKISAIGCHRLVESELEAFWIGRWGGPGKMSVPGAAPSGAHEYVGLLKRFGSEPGLLGEISSIYRRFLADSGLDPLPRVSRIRWCYLNQNILLRIFENRALGRRRDNFISLPITRYLGALIVPAQPLLPSGPLQLVPAARNPFTEEFMQKGFTSLTSLLCDFAERLSPFLPS